MLYIIDLLLKEMHDQHDASNDEYVLPNVITCNSITNACAQSVVNSENSNDDSDIKIMLRL